MVDILIFQMFYMNMHARTFEIKTKMLESHLRQTKLESQKAVTPRNLYW